MEPSFSSLNCVWVKDSKTDKKQTNKMEVSSSSVVSAGVLIR